MPVPKGGSGFLGSGVPACQGKRRALGERDLLEAEAELTGREAVYSVDLVERINELLGRRGSGERAEA